MQMTDWLAGGFLVLLIAVALLMVAVCLRGTREAPPSRRRGIQLADADGDHQRLLAEIQNGPDANNRSVEQLARHIKASHRQYGSVELTSDTFKSFIDNFNAGTYGQKIFVDIAHDPDKGAAAEITKVWAEGDKLLCEMQWTPMGVDAYNNRGYKYFSIEFDDYQDRETGVNHGPTLMGAGFVTRPFIKHMQPSQGPGRMYFSEDGKTAPVPGYLNITKAGDTMNWREKLLKDLKAAGLSDGVINQLMAGFDAQVKQLGDDEAALKAAHGAWVKAGTGLADEIGDKEVTLKIDAPTPGTGHAPQLSEKDVEQRLSKMLDDREAKAAQAKVDTDRKLSEVKAAFDKRINEAQGLSESVRDAIKKDWHATLHADTTDAQVTQFAELAIKAGNQQMTASKLSELGYNVGATGQHIAVGDEPVGQKLSEMMRTRLGNASSGSRLRLPAQDKVSPFARKVLAEYDNRRGKRLAEEVKVLAGEDGVNIADGDFPVAAERQVILETLSDLAILDLVNTSVEPTQQATTQIPYEIRNTGAVTNNGVVYEGQPIPYAGVQQKMDLAYIVPRKIAMLMSNEMIHFSRSSMIDWDAWARNIASNSRLNRELIARGIANEMQRAADSYNALPVTGETVTPVSATGVLTLANFPVVRPHTPRDLQGNKVGDTESPITITVGGNDVPAFDGSGKQSAGTYWRIASVNMGKLQLVDASGAPVTGAGDATVAYSYATNLVKVDLDTPNGADRGKHLNELLFAVGRRKAYLADDMFVTPDFGLSSNTLNETATEAEAYTANGARPAVNANAQGNLSALKSIPFWATNEPGIDLGDERMILGERGTLDYRIAKPFQTGVPFEAMDRETGQPTGQKIAYGEEYSTIHVPKPIRQRMTSVLTYSSSQR